jgi:hypothetical protein
LRIRSDGLGFVLGENNSTASTFRSLFLFGPTLVTCYGRTCVWG